MFTSDNFPTDDRPEMFPLCHYEWTKLYSVFVRKHGGRTAMQNYVLKRCLRNRQALEEHYRLSLHTSRRQKWYQYLEDRDVGNREALRALTEHMPKVTYVYMLHKVGAMLPYDIVRLIVPPTECRRTSQSTIVAFGCKNSGLRTPG